MKILQFMITDGVDIGVLLVMHKCLQNSALGALHAVPSENVHSLSKQTQTLSRIHLTLQNMLIPSSHPIAPSQ